MSTINELVKFNEGFAESFDRGDLPIPPARGIAILTCMDARLDPANSLGLDFGDAHVIRNAGGRASPDALRSLVISQRLLGTHEVAVIHHTDCGMLTFTNDDLRARLKEETGSDASEIDFLPFDDLEQSVRDDLQQIAASPFVNKDTEIRGFVYDVRSGRLEEIR